MTKRLVWTLCFILACSTLPAFAAGAVERAAVPHWASTATARPTFSDAILQRGKEIEQQWLTTRVRMSCIPGCTNDCYWAWFDCWYNSSQCEACCEMWRQCMIDNACCTRPPGGSECPTGCPVP